MSHTHQFPALLATVCADAELRCRSCGAWVPETKIRARLSVPRLSLADLQRSFWLKPLEKVVGPAIVVKAVPDGADSGSPLDEDPEQAEGGAVCDTAVA